MYNQRNDYGQNPYQQNGFGQYPNPNGFNNQKKQSVFSVDETNQKRDGAMWYVTILPILACFLENFTLNKWMGVILWGLVLIVTPVLCYIDSKRLKEYGVHDSDNLTIYAIICPVIYMTKRCQLLNQTKTKAVLFSVFTIFAIVLNGFVQGLTMDDNAFIDQVKNSYPINIEGYEDNMSYDNIDKHLSAFFDGDEVSYKIAVDGDKRYITARGKNKKKYNDKSVEIIFLIDFDGFTTKTFAVYEIKVGGKALSDNDKNKLLDDILLNADNESDDSSKSTQDSSDSNQSKNKLPAKSDESYTSA